MNGKAIFLDLDGTLLNDEKEVTPGNREAMERAISAGHRVVITTGRPLVSAIRQARQLALDGPGCWLIAYNGGVIYNLGAEKTLFQRTIPLDLVYPVFAEAARRRLHIQTYDNLQVLVEPRCDDESVRRYCQLTQMTSAVIPTVQALTQEPAKMLAIDCGQQPNLCAFRDWILKQFGEQLDSFFSCEQYLEIVPRGLNKGSALLRLAELLDIPWERTVAVGDAANDLSMLRAACVGVAMCNGTEEVKSEADDITARDNNHDGVAWVIEKYLLSTPE